ncbi:ABC transporter permease subunit [Gynuella sunshinyii]|uniref:Maltose/maltodextrin transport system permease protein MalG n=1 Tax=Gynuella sunshinyii YC6258 TaxID=1445510 RepID=A0A0C5VHY2_9GAMM|nr:ABC transporter permease subunit [Gynuella sunshinyii]AJQ93876.1 ABC-type maltose transport system, permease component [Gynuella sunshinyii YC6258]
MLRRVNALWVHLLLCGFILLVLSPMLMLISVSFRQGNFAVDEWIPKQPTLEHWYVALGQKYVGVIERELRFKKSTIVFDNGFGEVRLSRRGSWLFTPASEPEVSYLPQRLKIGLLLKKGETQSARYTQLLELVAEMPDRMQNGVIYIVPDMVAEGELLIGDLSKGDIHAVFDELYVREPEYKIVNWLINSLMVSVATAVISILIATPAALELSQIHSHRHRSLSTMLRGVLFFPSVLYLPVLFIIARTFGGLNNLWTLVIFNLTMVIFSVWLLKYAFRSVTLKMRQMAIVDGAGLWGQFRYLYLPICARAFVMVALCSFIASINEYPLASVLLTAPDVFTMSIGATQFINDEHIQWGDFAAFALLCSLPVVILMLLLVRYLPDILIPKYHE